jgi:hypothetical protein
VVLVALSLASWPVGAQQPASSDNPPAPDQQAAAAAQAERFKKFEQTLTGVRLVGRFTILGKETGDLPDEEYTIESVKKMPRGDFWLFQARIRYMDKDVTLPLPLEVQWDGDTPIITLTDLTIPVLGTFSSRVIIYNGKYAGTWTHGEAGGHMFGVIEKSKQAPDDE